MALACADGLDFDASPDPWVQKDELVREYCDPRVREPFLAALTNHTSQHVERAERCPS